MVLAAAWLLARALGPEARGAFLLLSTVASSLLFKLSHLEVNVANQVLVARDPSRAGAAAANALWYGLGTGAATVAMACVLYPLWGPRVLGMARVDLPLALMLAAAVLAVSQSQFEGILLGQRRFGYVNAVHVGATLFLLAALFLFLVAIPFGLPGACLAAAIQAILIFLLFGTPCLRGARLRPDPALFREQLSFGLLVAGVNLLGFAAGQGATFLLTHFGITLAAVGNYGLAKGLAEQTWVLTDSVTPVLLPGLSGMPPDEARATAARACRVLLALQALAALAAWGAAAWLLPLVLPDYTGVPAAVPWILPGVVLAAIPKVLSRHYVAAGRPALGLWVTGAGALATVGASFWLVPAQGIRGALAATSIGYAAEAIASLAVFTRLSGAGLLETLVIRPGDVRTYARRLAGFLAGPGGRG